MRAGQCGKIPPPPAQAPVKHKLLLSPVLSGTSWKCAAELTGALTLQKFCYWYILRVFSNASVKIHYPVKLSETLCRRYLFQNESALNLKNSLHNSAKKQRKSQWASYQFLLLSWKTRAFPLISLCLGLVGFVGVFFLSFQRLSWESLQNTQKLRKRKIQCWRRKAEQQVNVSWNSNSFSKTTFLRTVWQERKHAFGLFKIIVCHQNIGDLPVSNP